MTTVTTVAIKLAKMYIHREKIKFELMPKDGRSYRSAMIVKNSCGPSAPWVGSLESWPETGAVPTSGYTLGNPG